MKLIPLFALFCILSVAFCDTWVDLTPAELDDFEVNQALNFGAQNLTRDAINKGHIPEGVYRISAIESAQRLEDLTDNDATDNDDNGGDNYYRFVVEIVNDEGSGLNANYTVNVETGTVNGQEVYIFHVEDYTYNWFTNLDETEFDNNEEFEWIHEDEWNEFGQATENEALIVGSGSASVIDASDDPDSEVIVIQENGEPEWVNIDTIIPPDGDDDDLLN